MKIVIESNVPLVSGYGGISAALRKMNVGDSFVLPDATKEGSLRRLASRVSIKVAIRADVNGQRRCWRTA